MKLLFCICLMMGLLSMDVNAWEANYDEDKIPAYELPELLRMQDGSAVSTPDDWRTKRRPELIRLFEEHVYGRMPGRPEGMAFELLESDGKALEGKATRKQIRVRLGKGVDGPAFDLLLFIPNHVKRPVPGFLGLNFFGNHSISADPKILLSQSWMRNNKDHHTVRNRATAASRGTSSRRWPIERIIERGYALGAIYYGDIDPDFHDGFKNGVHPLVDEAGGKRSGAAWGAICAWAWGLSRGLDYLETDDDIDAARIAVIGHSRLGKTSLWAGATDERFAAAISNDSGCGGAALSRRCIGETVWRINNSFPHWFCHNFRQYDNNESALPVDQHQLIALVAPRPVYVASAEKDRWADPKGEFLAALHADPVYRLLGLEGLPATEMPSVDQPTVGRVGYHVRTGGHNLSPYDWEQYLDFMDRHVR